jgi:hypothetical protein
VAEDRDQARREAIDALREASRIALEASARLYDLTDPLLEPERPGNARLTASEYVLEVAREVRRHGLWLRGEADEGERRTAEGEPPATD